MDKMKDAILIALSKKGKSPLVDKEEKSDEHDEHLLDISKDLVNAVHAKDPQAVADLLKEAFECLESIPHEEADEEY